MNWLFQKQCYGNILFKMKKLRKLLIVKSNERFDDISSSFVNFYISGIFHPFKHIFNLSLQTGSFPNGMKVARIFKNDEELLFALNSIPLRLHTVTFSSIKIKPESFIKSLGVMLDKNIAWNKHI